MIADGVNWGYKPRLAARCGVHAAFASLNQQLFEKKITTTKVREHSIDVQREKSGSFRKYSND